MNFLFFRMSDTYLTIEKRHRTQIKIIGSKFIGTIKPVSSIQEAESFLNEMRQEFWDASHNCYGFHIQGTETRYSDDGEPSNTAGKPIYDHIIGNNLLYTMIVVTRYFGGTKLGTGGLIRAYGDSAKETLQSANIIEMIIYTTLKINHSYDHTSLVMRSINLHDAIIDDTAYTNSVELSLRVPKSKSDVFSNELFDQSNGQILITKN